MIDDLDAAPARVLVADDDQAAREIVGELLTHNGMAVEICGSGQEAVDRALGGEFDVVLLDVIMPDMGGLECCRLIKAKTSQAFLPVVMVTVRNSPEHRVEGLRIGADDYVGKPYDERELIARVGAVVRIKRMHDQLANARSRLQELATHDDLTGLYNYRYLKDRLSEEFRRCSRYGSSLGCVLFDIDRFKNINDQHGHLAGDQVLRQLASRVQEAVRGVDVVARYGGEEFLIIMPETDGDGSLVAAERVRKAAGDRPFMLDDGTEVRVTISAGTGHFPADGVGNADDLIRAADRALYKAKQAGRNRVRTPNDL